MLIYTAIKGSRKRGAPRREKKRLHGAATRRVTIWTGGTEAPDETAYGDWMKLVATAGLQWDKAILDYLVEGRPRQWSGRDRRSSAAPAMSLDRPRPPKPEAEKKDSFREPGAMRDV